MGVLLQIVPTLADVTMAANGGFVNANLQLSGSGFAEGAMSVTLGGQTLTDISRSAGLDSFSNAEPHERDRACRARPPGRCA